VATVKKVSLKDELRRDRGVEGPVPKMHRILASMSPEDRAEWKEVLADPNISTPAISRGLSKRGYQIGRIAIQRYRNGEMAHRES